MISASHSDRMGARSELRRFVGDIGFAESSSERRRDAFYAPRAETSILVRWTKAGAAVVNVIGPLTRARRKSFAAPKLFVRVLLRAGQARALLGVPISELADRVIPLEEIWGKRGLRLREDLSCAAIAHATDAVDIVQTAFIDRLYSPEVQNAPTATSSHGALLSRAMQQLDRGTSRMTDLADDLGVSSRHLRRVFQDDLGMTAKHYARITRIRRVLAHDCASASWAELAQNAGFHDQSHLIREFRDLLSVTPEAFRKTGDHRMMQPLERI